MDAPSIAEFARELGVSVRHLHRVLNVYEERVAPLPRAGNGKRRLDGEAVRVLREARTLVASGRVRSYEEALSVASGSEVLVGRQRLEALEARVRELEVRAQEMSRLLAQVSDRTAQIPVLLALARELLDHLKVVGREVAESRLILHASMENIARQDYPDLLGLPSLLQGRAPEKKEKPQEKPEEKPEERRKVPWYMR